MVAQGQEGAFSVAPESAPRDRRRYCPGCSAAGLADLVLDIHEGRPTTGQRIARGLGRPWTRRPGLQPGHVSLHKKYAGSPPGSVARPANAVALQ